ncbi:MAG: membrane protein insertion efficiency factor YidD [Bacteroidales bacterium]|nr:membrane protein insertion efficiency factor YidD [Bacteroidales bacterium]MDZ4203549.1 membrane protein insertion efficiency factor YidD [Bacteroidales bacterium]
MKIFITILLISSCLALTAQTTSEISIIKKHITAEAFTKSKDYSEYLGSIAGSVFFFYKHVFSSQDYNSCNFTPSCSEYAIQSIQKQGLLAGLLNSFDRLTRCHGLSVSKYHLDPHTHRLIDPPHDAHFEEL